LSDNDFSEASFHSKYLRDDINISTIYKVQTVFAKLMNEPSLQ